MAFKKCIYCGSMMHRNADCTHPSKAEVMTSLYGSGSASEAVTERADPLMKIIEAAYHCAWHNHEIHAAVKEAGLDEVSDETIANLLGEYENSVKPTEV